MGSETVVQTPILCSRSSSPSLQALWWHWSALCPWLPKVEGSFHGGIIITPPSAPITQKQSLGEGS